MSTTLEQLRRWLRGAEVEGLPPHPKPAKPQVVPESVPIKWKRCKRCKGTGDDGRDICPACDGIGEVPRIPTGDKPDKLVEKMRAKALENRRRSRGSGKYRISAAGDDAMLLFGKHRDSNISDIAKNGPDYLEWMLKEGTFPADLIDIVKIHLAKVWRKTRTKRWLQLRAMELELPERDAELYTEDGLIEFIMDNM